MGKIMAVNISEKKGTQKKNVHSARLMEEFGIEKDAHAGKWHRQVSLLSYEKIEEFKAKGAPIEDGAFGENLIVSGYDLKALPVGTRLRSGEVLLEVTQIGKKCHSGCEIYKIMGDCIMPREGIFTRVLHGGVLTEGDEIVIEKAAGVEMEALTGVNVALLTIYDMCKAIDKSMELTDIHLVEKSGGKSGLYRNPKE